MPTIRVEQQEGLFTCPGNAHTREQVDAGLCSCRRRDCGHTVANGRTCGTCGWCRDCCECYICARCDNRFLADDFCSDCDRCHHCCSCGSRGEVPFRSGRLTFWPSMRGEANKPGIPKLTDLKENPLKRHVSVELEVDNFDHGSGGALAPVVQKWNDGIVHDGSLSGGFEVNTNPSAGDFLVRHLRDYAAAFERMGPARAGVDCGMHVHVNAKDFRQYDLRKLVVLYGRIERALFDACHPRRLNTRYAQLCGRFYRSADKTPKDFRANLNYKLYGESAGGYIRQAPRPAYRERIVNGNIVRVAVRNRRPAPRPSRRDIVVPSREIGAYLTQQKQEKYYSLRYKALNLHSWFLRGTVEFRHKEGLTKFDDMLGWSRLIGTVVEQALALPDKEIGALPSNSRQALIAIMPTDLQAWLKDTWAKFDRSLTERQLAYKREVWAAQGDSNRENPEQF